MEHRLSNFLEWGTLPWQYGIVPVTLALALLINLKQVLFCYSLKLNFICYPNRFFTYDSLWDGGDIRFCGQKQTLIIIDFIDSDNVSSLNSFFLSQWSGIFLEQNPSLFKNCGSLHSGDAFSKTITVDYMQNGGYEKISKLRETS